MRSTKIPPRLRASSQLNSAVLALPTWSGPEGLGANRTRTAAAGALALVVTGRPCHEQRYGMHGHGLTGAHRVAALVRLALDADSITFDAKSVRQVLPHLLQKRGNLRPLGDHHHIDADDDAPCSADQLGCLGQ